MLANYGEVWMRVADAVPDRIAVQEVGGGSMTYRELQAAGRRTAAALQDAGVRPGDKLAIDLHNRPEWIITLFAAFLIGAAPVPINFRYREREVDGLLETSDAVALVYPASAADVIGRLETPARRPLLLVQVGDDPSVPLLPGALDFTALAHSDRPLSDTPAHAPEGGELFLVTGGTTGAPKGVVWGLPEMFDVQGYATYGALGIEPPETIDEVVRIAASDDTQRPVTLPLAPLMHGTALTSTLNTLTLGGTVVIVSSTRFDPAQVLQAMEEYGITRLVVAGDAVALRLLDALGSSGTSHLPRLTSVMSSGMRFSDATKAKLHSLGHVTITDLLAASECGAYAMAVSSSADDLPARLTLTPPALLVDEQLRPIDMVPGAVGLLAFDGSAPKGYYRDEERSAATFPIIEGRRMVVPGDWAKLLGDDRTIELLGRGSAVVNTGGEKVYPGEVEEVLLKHPWVSDAVVLGIPDPEWGEVVAAVIASNRPELTEAEIVAHVGAELAGYKKPRRVLIRESLDRSPTGKVDLALLRAEFVRAGLAPSSGSGDARAHERAIP